LQRQVRYVGDIPVFKGLAIECAYGNWDSSEIFSAFLGSYGYFLKLGCVLGLALIGSPRAGANQRGHSSCTKRRSLNFGKTGFLN
jgi:hypothetical protein